eukprot:gene11630-15577_t
MMESKNKSFIISFYIFISICLILNKQALAFSFPSITLKNTYISENQGEHFVKSHPYFNFETFIISRSVNLFRRKYVIFASTTTSDIVSPFDASKQGNATTDDDDDDNDDDELPLTRENVELVLDEMRPYLMQDGGNVNLAEIDGPIVKLELVGACGTCPSSSMTMKMGLERKLKERIPEIAEVIQTLPNAPVLSNENVETVLDGVRPFLSVAGGKISIVSITGVSGLQPVVALKMEGTATALQSVKIEIMQRIQRHFMQSLRIDWVN